GIAGYAIAGFVIVEGLRAMALDPGLIPLVHTFALVRGRIPPRTCDFGAQRNAIVRAAARLRRSAS
ncbi:MAG: hypothetical protein ACRD29_17615, partial [Acidimicrobiales bacterium]